MVVASTPSLTLPRHLDASRCRRCNAVSPSEWRQRSRARWRDRCTLHDPDCALCRISMASSDRPSNSSSPSIARVVDRNIEALVARRQAEERTLSWEDRVASAISRFTGSMPFVYVHLVGYGLWVAINLGWVPGIAPFDP